MAFRLNSVVCGAVVKTNEPTHQDIVTYVRSDTGVLIDRSDTLQALRPTWDDLQDDLIGAVSARANAGLPFNKTGKGGLYGQRERLPPPCASSAETGYRISAKSRSTPAKLSSVGRAARH